MQEKQLGPLLIRQRGLTLLDHGRALHDERVVPSSNFTHDARRHENTKVVDPILFRRLTNSRRRLILDTP